jgi:hypothetical protein
VLAVRWFSRVQLVAVQLGLLRSYELHTHDRNGASGGRGLVEAHA